MVGDGKDDPTPLEHTPTWIVAVVCSLMVVISLALERFLHFLGKYLKKKNQKSLFEALQKVKDELMIMGFISLLLTVFQDPVSRICISKSLTVHMLPCKKEKQPDLSNSGRHLLAEESKGDHCTKKGMVPFLSYKALHKLHIFIFILAIVHVVFCLLTMILASAKIRQWKRWEDEIAKEDHDTNRPLVSNITQVHQHVFIRQHFLGTGKYSAILSWMHCFIKQFYASVNKTDYITLRLGFIMMHCRGNPKFNFHKYMIRALEADFKKVVGISSFLWIFVVIFLLLNIDGWHTYFWIAFIPLILLLAVGTKMEHVMTQLANEVAEKHIAVEGELVVRPSDENFWFNRPKIVLSLIHFILFQNAFEIAFFFWILMGSSFKKVIFDEHVQEGLVGWVEKVKKKEAMKAVNAHDSNIHVRSADGSSVIQLQMMGERERGTFRRSTALNGHDP
ncbi:MLO-like protein 1 isoform X2 [Magnolia sinica]|uniref:MLO-like protein 1 isoform X2 n=1 Tax=Magnolia sinica TaxID=86752 RepID=UPI00265A0987|nr:MLO-like protein 1 isoform X2 [Magnolia sinica]